MTIKWICKLFNRHFFKFDEDKGWFIFEGNELHKKCMFCKHEEISQFK